MNQHIQYHDDEIDLLELFSVIFKGKITIAFTIIVCSVIAVIYSLSLPNIYKSEALLVTSESSYSSSSNMESYNGISQLAGINLSSQNSQSNSSKALEKLYTLSFFEKNILPNIFLAELMAYKSWDAEKNLSTFNKEIYDIDKNQWVRNTSFPLKVIPSAQESFKIFHSKHLEIDKDKKVGFIKLSIKHQSPYIAKNWVQLIVDEINKYYREKDRAEAERAFKYLNTQISKTNYAETKAAISFILQKETKKLTLIEANENYVFEYIDPPVVMELKNEPKRSLICIFGALIGMMLGIFIVLIRHFVYKSNTY
jgi:LPS O-antigen subunit length determinant protein (WzzB/FepE family)